MMRYRPTENSIFLSGANYLYVAALIIVTTAALSFASDAVAVVPDNDDRSAATIVSIGYSETIDTTEATMASDDQFECGWPNQSVWYSFTPDETTWVGANTFGSDYNTTLTVYKSDGLSLEYIACNNDADGDLQSRVQFEAQAGVTYLFMVTLYPTGPPGGSLTFSLIPGAPPAPVLTDLTLDSRGAFSSRSGSATLSGSVTCNIPTFVFISGTLNQRLGRFFSVSGSGLTTIACDGTTEWSLDVSSSDGRFRGWRAFASIDARADEDDSYDEVSATVWLTRSRRR